MSGVPSNLQDLFMRDARYHGPSFPAKVKSEGGSSLDALYDLKNVSPDTLKKGLLDNSVGRPMNGVYREEIY
jgi:hypothetical protein